MGTVIERGVILSACAVDPALGRYLRAGDFIVACDAGYRNAQRLGVTPDLILGDFDSAPRPAAGRAGQIVLPHVKDDTDTHYAARWLLEHGCRQAVMLGALGGRRMEHTQANLATGLYLSKNGVHTILADEHSEVHYLLPGVELALTRTQSGRRWQYLSVFPMGESLTGVCIQGAFYPLEDAVLTHEYPLAVSNEFLADTVRLRCKTGCGLVILTENDSEPKNTVRA